MGRKNNRENKIVFHNCGSNTSCKNIFHNYASDSREKLFSINTRSRVNLKHNEIIRGLVHTWFNLKSKPLHKAGRLALPILFATTAYRDGQDLCGTMQS